MSSNGRYCKDMIAASPEREIPPVQNNKKKQLAIEPSPSQTQAKSKIDPVVQQQLNSLEQRKTGFLQQHQQLLEQQQRQQVEVQVLNQQQQQQQQEQHTILKEQQQKQDQREQLLQQQHAGLEEKERLLKEQQAQQQQKQHLFNNQLQKQSNNQQGDGSAAVIGETMEDDAIFDHFIADESPRKRKKLTTKDTASPKNTRWRWKQPWKKLLRW